MNYETETEYSVLRKDAGFAAEAYISTVWCKGLGLLSLDLELTYFT